MSTSKVVDKNANFQMATPKPAVSPNAVLAANTDGGILNDVNNFRERYSLSRLSTKDNLCSFANIRLSEVKSNFSHEGFSKIVGLGYHGGAENIAKTAKGTGYIINEMWANSEGHRKNMLADYSFGCGVYNGTVAVFLFAK